MKYAVYIIKSSRKPYFVKRGLKIDDAMLLCNQTYENWKLLSNADLAVSGVSTMIINADDCKRADAVEIGGLAVAGITVLYQCGGY